MVTNLKDTTVNNLGSEQLKIVSFAIAGLFGRADYNIPFPNSISESGPGILILSGLNGSGKTTILKMIEGVLKLDFDIFRKVPFKSAQLKLSNGKFIDIIRTKSKQMPLKIVFEGESAELAFDKSSYTPEQREKVDIVRQIALPHLNSIDFELLDIHRSLPLSRNYFPDTAEMGRFKSPRGAGYQYQLAVPPDQFERESLKKRVSFFMREAQLNYRRFFSAKELELLPRILQRLRENYKPADRTALLTRVLAIQSRFVTMKRFGLQTDDADLETLTNILQGSEYPDTDQSLAIIEGYVEIHESRNKARELIAKRLVEFEEIMDDFLVGKQVRIHAQEGIQINSSDGPLEETDLSSGEFHFLCMMVSALLCQRIGSIIAIDEPELSLHVTWQRKIIRALARCASGASPLFLFATHSAAISAEYSNNIFSLSGIE